MATAQLNLICAACREFYRSPRFLPCHHSFCLECLEQLANRHGNVIPRPTCRARATLSDGGVRDLQVNFYLTEEALEEARSEAGVPMCPVHSKQCAILHCTQCKEAICMMCKLTKHEGHATEELSVTAARSKETIRLHKRRLYCFIKDLKTKSKAFKKNEMRAKEKRESVKAQIQARYGVIAAMAATYRDQALKEVEEISKILEKDLAADAQQVQNAQDSLLQLHERVNQALSSTACDTDVLQVEEDMTRGPGSDEHLRELKAKLPDMTYRPGFHGDFSNNIEDEIKRYIGSPVKLTFKSHNEVAIVRIARCRDEECQEVFDLREREDKTIDVLYGLAGDFSKPKQVAFGPDGFRGEETQLESKKSYVTRKNFCLPWNAPYWRRFGSKGDSMFSLHQNCRSGDCDIFPMEFKTENSCTWDLVLIKPQVNKVHSFDSTKCGLLFAVIDEDEGKKENSTKKSGKKDRDTLSNPYSRAVLLCPNIYQTRVATCVPKQQSSAKKSEKNQDSLGNPDTRVVRLYSQTCNAPVATYVPPKRPFFPTDICFYDNDLLLIADWVNDCVHVVTVTDNSLTFNDYLSGSGDIVRPTALNLDLNGRLLIGCGDGWILKHCADISENYKVEPSANFKQLPK